MIFCIFLAFSVDNYSLREENKTSIHLGLAGGSLYIKYSTSTKILIVKALIGLYHFKVFKEILSYSHEIYNINDWSFFLVRKFTNLSKKNLLIYIKPSKSNYTATQKKKNFLT